MCKGIAVFKGKHISHENNAHVHTFLIVSIDRLLILHKLTDLPHIEIANARIPKQPFPKLALYILDFLIGQIGDGDMRFFYLLVVLLVRASV